MVNGVGPKPHPEHSAAQLRRTPQICFDMVTAYSQQKGHSERAYVCVFTKGVPACAHVLQRVWCEVCAQAVREQVCRKPHTALSQEAGWSPPPS